jgi:hypothetical protein
MGVNIVKFCYTTTHKNTNVDVDNRYLLYLYFQLIKCLNIKKYAIHKIHDSMGPYARGARATAQCTHALRWH